MINNEILQKSHVKLLIVGICILILGAQELYASKNKIKFQAMDNMEQTLMKLSKEKWQWMTECNVDSLDNLFHKQAVFVHMGATFNKSEELNVIKNKQIIYKDTEVKQTSVRFIGSTAILLDKIRLTAIVGGNEVVNLFMVTEVYVYENEKWLLVSLSFTKLINDN